MRLVAQTRAWLRHCRTLAVAAVLGACATPPTIDVVEVPIEPITLPDIERRVLVLPEPVAPPAADPVPVIVEKPQPLVSLVLSSRQPAYESVAVALSKRLDNVELYDLSDKSQPPVSAFQLIRDSESSAVVAIGLRAAISATSMSHVPVVFCQVFNFNQYNLLTDNSRGVSALPPLDLQIAAWKQVDPQLKSIGAIIGDGHDDLIAEAHRAAEKHGIELHIRRASSDRETLYLFNRLAGQIDGFWLFPDNRVLSATVLGEILSYAAVHRVRVSVFNESLLEMGASLSASTVQDDIAETIVDVLEAANDGRLEELPPITGLSDINVATNDAVLQRLTAEPRPGSQATLVKGQ